MLRAILAHLEYQHIVRQYGDFGVPFRAYQQVPEVNISRLCNDIFREKR